MLSLKQALKSQKSEKTEIVKALQEDHATELQKLQSKFDKTINTLKTKHATELEQRRVEDKKKLEKLLSETLSDFYK